MAQTQPPNIDPVPAPPIQRGDRATFSNRVDAFIRWLVNAVTQFQAVASNVYNNAIDVYNNSRLAVQSANSSAVDAANAARDALSAINAPGTNGTSSTSLVISTGPKTLTLLQKGKLFRIGQTVIVSSNTADNWMAGPIGSFNPDSGEMTINVTNLSGSGTFNSWVVSLSGPAGITGILNEQKGANIASSATVNLSNSTGNLVHITGTASISAFTLPIGAERALIFDSPLILINSPSLLLPGNSNISVAAGDRVLVRGDSNGAIITHYQRADGTPVFNPPNVYALVSSAVITAPVANVDFLNIFTNAYDKYVIETVGITPPSQNYLMLQLANAGVIDSASRYITVGAGVGTSASLTPDLTNVAASLNLTIEIKNVNSNKDKTIDSRSAYRNNSGSGSLTRSSIYTGTSTVSGFRLFFDTGNFSSGIVRIYGIRNSQ